MKMKQVKCHESLLDKEARLEIMIESEVKRE